MSDLDKDTKRLVLSEDHRKYLKYQYHTDVLRWRFTRKVYASIDELEQRNYTKTELIKRDKIKQPITLNEKWFIDRMSDEEKAILFCENIIKETKNKYLIGDNRTCSGHHVHGVPRWNQWVEIWVPKTYIEPDSLTLIEDYKPWWLRTK